MTIKTEDDRFGPDAAQGHIDSELIVLAPEPAAFDLRPVARDEHHFAQFVRVGGCSDHPRAFPGFAVERTPAPTVTGVNQTAAITRDDRAVFDISQFCPGRELVFRRAGFDYDLAVNAAAANLIAGEKPAPGQLRRAQVGPPCAPFRGLQRKGLRQKFDRAISRMARVRAGRRRRRVGRWRETAEALKFDYRKIPR